MRLKSTDPLGSVDRASTAPATPAENQRIAEGFQFCALASELRSMLSGLRADLAKLNWSPADGAQIQESIGEAAARS